MGQRGAGIAVAVVAGFLTGGIGAFAGAAAAGVELTAGAFWGGALAYAALGGGIAALGLLTQKKGPRNRDAFDDIVLTTSVRNLPVPVLFGRARIGGNWLLLGNFYTFKDADSSTPEGKLYLFHGVLGLCEGTIEIVGNPNQDGRSIVQLARQLQGPVANFQYNLVTGTSTDTLHADLTDTTPARRYPELDNLAPWANTAKVYVKTITETPHLLSVNLDAVGRKFTLTDSGLTGESSESETPGYGFYDAYTESFYFTCPGGEDKGLGRMPRGGAGREHTAPPTDVGSITNGWYVGRHDVLVYQDPSDDAKFYVGHWGIDPDEWETFRPSPEGHYDNEILVHYLDEQHGILHTLHDDETTVYIMRWTLVSGRIERLDTDLSTGIAPLAFMYSPDFAAYIVTATGGHTWMVDQATGLQYLDTTDLPNSGAKGMFVSGQRIATLTASAVRFYDPSYDTLDSTSYGSSSTGTTKGYLGGTISAHQNSWTGHITLTTTDGGDVAFINFIASVDETSEDLSAKGSKGFTGVAGNFNPLQEFQTFPAADSVAGWIRDWSYRTYGAYDMTRLEGASSLAAAAWAACVDVPALDTARWGAGLPSSLFSISSFEHLHSFCVGGVQYPSEPTEPNEDPEVGATYRYAQRCKFDYLLDGPMSVSQLLSSQILASCNGYRYVLGGKLHVGVQKPGVFPQWHFTDQNIQAGSGATTYVSSRANRVRVQYKRIKDEYRGDWAEWNNEFDQDVKGRVISETISIEGIGRLGHAKWLARVVGDRMSDRRQFGFKTSFVAYVITAHDPIEISSTAHALSRMPAIVTSIKENEAGEIGLDTLEHIPMLDGLRNAADNPPPNGGEYEPPENDETEGCVRAEGSTDETVRWFSNGAAYAAGPYYVSYQAGAYRQTTVSPSEYFVSGYDFVSRDGTGAVTTIASAPAVTDPGSGYASTTAAETANSGQWGTITLSASGPIGLKLSSSGLDNDEGRPNPTYELCIPEPATYYQAEDCDGEAVDVWLLNTGQTLPYSFKDDADDEPYVIPSGAAALTTHGYIPASITEGDFCEDDSPAPSECPSGLETTYTLTFTSFDYSACSPQVDECSGVDTAEAENIDGDGVCLWNAHVLCLDGKFMAGDCTIALGTYLGSPAWIIYDDSVPMAVKTTGATPVGTYNAVGSCATGTITVS